MAEVLPVYTGKKGPRTYKEAKGPTGRGSYSGHGQKSALNKRIKVVDKKVKRVSNRIMKHHSVNPGKPAHDGYKII